MGPLLQTILAVVVLGLSELGTVSEGQYALAILPLVLTPYALAIAARASGLRGHFGQEHLLARLQMLSPILTHAIALTLCGWRQTVSGWTGDEVSFLQWPRPALLLLFAPFVATMLASIDARARVIQGARNIGRELRSMELRMFVVGLIPLVGFILGSAVVGLSLGLRVRLEEVSIYSAAFTALLLVAMVAGLPFFLRLLFDSEPLPHGLLRSSLEQLAARARFRCRELVVWRTGSLQANAAILGLWPSQRLVVFSDALLAQLGPGELHAVFAHEMGHAKRHHVPIFFAWTCGFFLCADLFSRWIDPSGGLVAMAVVTGTLALWLATFVQLSRRFELEADLFALELLGEGETLARALEIVGGRLRDVASMRHFSVNKRTDFLRRAEREPEFVRRFRASLRRWTLVALSMFVVGAALEIVEVRRIHPFETALVELRLGRVDDALTRVEGLARGGDERNLARLAERSEAEAAFELEADQPEGALEWLRLGAAAGEYEPRRLAEGIELVLAGRERQAAARLASSPDDWRARIAAWLARRAGDQ